jgi:hypothetical protein
MKDRNNVELVEGDFIMIVIDNPQETPALLVIYLDNEEYTYEVTENGEERSVTTNTIKYYPITDEGLEVAKFDASVTQLLPHREKKFNITNIHPDNVIKMNTSVLRGYNKTLFDSITALL